VGIFGDFLLLPEEATITRESDLVFIIGDKGASVGGQIFLYPFHGRGKATEEMAEELGELENLLVLWKTNYGKTKFKKRLSEVV